VQRSKRRADFFREQLGLLSSGEVAAHLGLVEVASPHGAGSGALFLSTHTGTTNPTSVETALKSAGQPVSLDPNKGLLVSGF
jgi:hypothetical protein